MGVLIDDTDFVGRYAIPQSVFSDLDTFITDQEEKYLIEMLGAEFYTVFKADLTNKVPVTQKFLDIFNPFKEDYNDTVVISKGMKEMLKGFIYFDYMRNEQYKATTQGTVVNSADTSKNVSPANLFNYYNDSVVTYCAIQKYINRINPDDYTDLNFNGVHKRISIPFF